MVAPNPNDLSLHIPRSKPLDYVIVGELAVFHFENTSVALDPARVRGIFAPDLGVRVILVEGGAAVSFKSNAAVAVLAELIDRAAREIDGEPVTEPGQEA